MYICTVGGSDDSDVGVTTASSGVAEEKSSMENTAIEDGGSGSEVPTGDVSNHGGEEDGDLEHDHLAEVASEAEAERRRAHARVTNAKLKHMLELFQDALYQV